MRIGKYVLVAAALAAAGMARRAGATIVFSDDFSNGSSVPISPTAYPATTANSTGYALAASKNQSPAPSIAAGHLKFGIASTTSGLEEAQARFTNTPVSLANPNEYVELSVTFINTGLLTTGSTTSGQLDFGLYNSAGSNPYTDLSVGATTGLLSSVTTDAVGGVAPWTGYVSQLFFTGGSSKIVTRPAQTGPDNTNQDLIGNNFSASNSYHSPVGTSLVSSSTPSATLTNGDQYTETLRIVLTAANTYQIITTLFDNTTATQASTQTVSNVTGGNFFSNFDGFAIGYRETGSVASLMDINQITVQTGIVPEPASLVGLALAGLIVRRRAIR